MGDREYTVFYSDLSKQSVIAPNILKALQSIPDIDHVVRISLYEKGKFELTDRVVDEDFDGDEYRPSSGL